LLLKLATSTQKRLTNHPNFQVRGFAPIGIMESWNDGFEEVFYN